MTSILLIGFFLTLPVVADTDGKEAAHAIYISVVEIDHRDPSKQTQVKIKVFTDDLENALRNTFGHPFQLPDAQACLKEKQAIDDYFQQHFKLEVDGKKTVLSFQKGERNNDATWLYFDLAGPKQWQDLLITADFFMELFPTQTTTLTLYKGDALWFKKFTADEVACRINL